MDLRLRRMNKEMNDCKSDTSSDITIDLIDNSPFHLKGSFPGEKDTPYEGGTFEVDIIIPEPYPFQPPKMRFITKVYHPNVFSASGSISLDILAEAWCPSFTVRITLILLRAFLCSPEPSNPLDAKVAEHYRASKQSFEETARYWTQVYARGSGSQGESPQIDDIAIAGLKRAHVDEFEGFGFERSKVIEVLRRLNYRGSNVANISEDRVMEELFK